MANRSTHGRTSEDGSASQEGDSLYRARLMATADIRPAYAVIASVRPDISLDEWCAHTRCCLDLPVLDETSHSLQNGGYPRRTGAVVATGPNGYIVGVFTFASHRALGTGLTLDIHDFCVVTIARRMDATAAMLGYAESLGRQFNCTGLRVNFLENEAWQTHATSADWSTIAAGFQSSPPALSKRIA